MLVNAEEQHQIEQFYYEEAACLDEARYTDWLTSFTEDARYWVPIRQTRLTGQLDEEFTKPGEIALFDEDINTLGIRVRKLQSEYMWGENPPSRSRHLITNVRVTAREEDSLSVATSFLFFRGYMATDADWWVGRREDVLRTHGDGFKIARRHVFLDQTVILAKNLSQFF